MSDATIKMIFIGLGAFVMVLFAILVGMGFCQQPMTDEEAEKYAKMKQKMDDFEKNA